MDCQPIRGEIKSPPEQKVQLHLYLKPIKLCWVHCYLEDNTTRDRPGHLPLTSQG